MRILIVDGNLHDRMFLVRRFRSMPATCDEAATFGKAVELCRKHLYDAVLLDLRLSDSSSAEDSCRRIPELENDSVFILTGNADGKLVKLAIESGARDLFIKGVDLDVVIGRVESLINRRNPTQEQSSKVAGIREVQAKKGDNSAIFSVLGISLTEKGLIWAGQIVLYAAVGFGIMWMKLNYVSRLEWETSTAQLRTISDTLIRLEAKMRRDDEQDNLLDKLDKRLLYLEHK